MKISLIVSMAENRVIGRDGTLPWHISDELKYFKATTWDHAVIMGRKSVESLKRSLPNREIRAITRDSKYQAPFEGVKVYTSLQRALQDPVGPGSTIKKDEIFVAGGGEIYRLALPMAERLYLTVVHQEVAGDTFFPEVDLTQWIEKSQVPKTSGEWNYTHFIYDRK